MVFRIGVELCEHMVPDDLHGVPIRDDSVFDRMSQTKLESLLESFRTNDTRFSNIRREHEWRKIASGEPSLE